MKISNGVKFKINIKGKEYEVGILEVKEGTKIKVGDKEFFFKEKEIKKEVSFPPLSFKKRNFSKKEIKAPIAGTISEVFIKEGDFVGKGEKLLCLSAMKMENEIVSEFEGKIKKVLIKKDQKVKEGEDLILLEWRLKNIKKLVQQAN